MRQGALRRRQRGPFAIEGDDVGAVEPGQGFATCVLIRVAGEAVPRIRPEDFWQVSAVAIDVAIGEGDHFAQQDVGEDFVTLVLARLDPADDVLVSWLPTARCRTARNCFAKTERADGQRGS